MLASAASVFLIGQRLFPIEEAPELPPPPAIDGSAVEAAAPPAADAGGPEAAVVEGGAVDGPATSDAGPGPAGEAGATMSAVEADAADGSSPDAAAAGARAAATLDPQQKLEKEIARAAWRKNAPDIRVVGRKAVMVIPIKGSIDDAKHKLRPRTRTIEVNLPNAASLATLRFYKGKDGFKQLWVEQEEKTVDPEKGTTLKIVLHESVGPKVEIKDEFVRVTIPRRHPPSAPKDKEEGAASEGAPAEAESAPLIE